MRSPLPPTTPYPALGAVIPDGQPGYARRTIGLLPAARQRAFGLPLSREDAGRASVRRRSFRPCGAAISSAPCRAYVSKRNRRSHFASGTSSPAVERGKRLSFVESVHCAGKTVLGMGDDCSPLTGAWAAISPPTQRGRAWSSPFWDIFGGPAGEGTACVSRRLSILASQTGENAPCWSEHKPGQDPPAQRAGRGGWSPAGWGGKRGLVFFFLSFAGWRMPGNSRQPAKEGKKKKLPHRRAASASQRERERKKGSPRRGLPHMSGLCRVASRMLGRQREQAAAWSRAQCLLVVTCRSERVFPLRPGQEAKRSRSGRIQGRTLRAPLRTACRFAGKTRSFRLVSAGRRSAAAPAFAFENGKTH